MLLLYCCPHNERALRHPPAAVIIIRTPNKTQTTKPKNQTQGYALAAKLDGGRVLAYIGDGSFQVSLTRGLTRLFWGGRDAVVFGGALLCFGGCGGRSEGFSQKKGLQTRTQSTEPSLQQKTQPQPNPPKQTNKTNA
jgi:hypothetical protein